MPRLAESPTRFHFTKTALDAVEPPPSESRSSQTEVCDTSCSGLRYSASRTGRRFWFLRYRYRNRKRCIKLGEYPGMSLKQARDRAWEMKALLARGEDPAAWKHEQAAVTTFREFVEAQYLPHMRATVRRPDVIESRLNTGALPWFKDTPLDAISTRGVHKFHTAMKERLSATTANHHLVLVKRILGLAVQWQVIPSNTATGVRKFAEPSGVERYLSALELKRFTKALDECDNVPVASGLRTLLLTGLRSREVFELPWADVDPTTKSILLRKTKAGKARRVYLSEAAWAEIERMGELRQGKHPYVFPGRMPGTPVKQPRTTFKRILKAAGIENFRIHDLRHTFASHMVQSGATLFEVQRALGHANTATTARYAHLSDEGLRQSTQKAVARLTGTDG